MTYRIREASMAGEWGLSRRAFNGIGNPAMLTATVAELPTEENISKLLQIGESLRHLEGDRIAKAEICKRAPYLSIEKHEVDGLLQQLTAVGLTSASPEHVTPVFRQKDLYGALSETWASKANDFERHIIDKSLAATRDFIELDPSSRNDEMLIRLNENLKTLHINNREEDKILAVSSRYVLRTGKGIFKILKPPLDVDKSILKQCLKTVDDSSCQRPETLGAVLNQTVNDRNKTNHLMDWFQDIGILIPHTVKIGDTPHFYTFPARVIDLSNLDSEKIAPNVRDIIAHFRYASEFSTVKYPDFMVGVLASGKSIGPALDIPSKYMALISRGIVKVEDKKLVAIDKESFQRAETFLYGGENIDFSKIDLTIPKIPRGSMLYGEVQTKILLDAAKKGGLHTL